MKYLYTILIVALLFSCSDNKESKAVPLNSNKEVTPSNPKKQQESIITKDTLVKLKKQVATTDFKVSDVVMAKELLITNDSKKIFENKIGKEITFFPKEHHNKEFVTAYNNGFIQTIQQSYDDHRPLVLSPDVIWLAITQGVSIHINQNFKTLEKTIFKGEKPKKLIVRNDSLQYGAKHWEKLIATLANDASQYTNNDYYSFFVPKFSTTNKTNTTAYQITLLNSYKKAFTYVGESGCGIPIIKLKGTKSDWEKIYKNLETLDKIGLSDWKEELKPVIKEFINIYDNKINKKFWQDMYKSMSEYGAFYISGWVVKFFPYLEEEGNQESNDYNIEHGGFKVAKKFIRNKYIYGDMHYLSTLSTDDFPSGIVDIDVTFNNYFDNTTEKYNIYAGFFAIKQEKDKSLEPIISWAIAKKYAPKVDYKLKYKYIRPNNQNDPHWTPYIIKKSNALYNPKAFNNQQESLDFVKNELLKALKNNFNKEDYYNKELSFVVLSNGKIEGVVLKGNKKTAVFIKKFLNNMEHEWFPALANSNEMWEDWQEYHKEESIKIKVNSKISLLLNDESAYQAISDDEGFTKVVTDKGKVFFSNIDIINYEKPNVKGKNGITNLDALANDTAIYFSYNIEATGDPRTAIEYVIEDSNSQTIFKKESYDNDFEYECTKKYIDNTLQLFHKKTFRGEDYNPKKPLITIYKKNNAYYAISPLIEEGNPIKLNTKH